MHKHDIENMQTYCIVDRQPIPAERAKQKSNTCSKECRKKLNKYRRAQVDVRRCRHCFKPSTREERAQFRLWKRSQPEHAKKKTGPKKRGDVQPISS